MKSLQDGKLVFVCVQNDKTKSNDAAMQGVRDFKADVRFASATEIVTLDPTDKKEATFLTDLKVSPDTAEAATVFVAPPGKAIGKFEGATNKDALVELISKASSGCAGQVAAGRVVAAQRNEVSSRGRDFPDTRAGPLTRRRLPAELSPPLIRVATYRLYTDSPIWAVSQTKTTEENEKCHERQTKRCGCRSCCCWFPCWRCGLRAKPRWQPRPPRLPPSQAEPPTGHEPCDCRIEKACQGQQVPVHLLLRGTGREHGRHERRLSRRRWQR